MNYGMQTTLLTGGVAVYIMMLLWRLFERRRKMSIKTILTAILTPCQNALQQVAYLLPRRPWLGLLATLLVLYVFSLIGALVTVAVAESFRYLNTLPYQICWSGAVAFLAATVWYYYRHVLKMSPASLLLSLHPRGVEMSFP